MPYFGAPILFILVIMITLHASTADAKTKAAMGALIGGSAGLATGALIGMIAGIGIAGLSCADEGSSPSCSHSIPWQAPVTGALITGAIGAGIGALIGSFIRTDKPIAVLPSVLQYNGHAGAGISVHAKF